MNPLRVVLSLMGFLVAVLAIAQDDHRLGWAAIALLGSSFGLRIVGALVRRIHGPESDSPDSPA